VAEVEELGVAVQVDLFESEILKQGHHFICSRVETG
jgi:hypothetical protein